MIEKVIFCQGEPCVLFQVTCERSEYKKKTNACMFLTENKLPVDGANFRIYIDGAGGDWDCCFNKSFSNEYGTEKKMLKKEHACAHYMSLKRLGKTILDWIPFRGKSTYPYLVKLIESISWHFRLFDELKNKKNKTNKEVELLELDLPERIERLKDFIFDVVTDFNLKDGKITEEVCEEIDKLDKEMQTKFQGWLRHFNY